MEAIAVWIDGLSWVVVIAACLTLGLAPFSPPHLVENLQMLASGTLSRPLDWFDLCMHATPWLLALVKGVLSVTRG